MEHLYLKEDKSPSKRLNALQRLAKDQGIPVSFVSKHQLNQFCADNPHQGAVLKCSPLSYADSEVFENRQSTGPQIFVALDQIEDPHNLGAIIRSCGFFDIDGIIVPRSHSIGLTPVVSKASAGVLEFFPVIEVPNLARFLQEQKKNHFWIIGLDGEAEQDLQGIPADRSLVLVLGNEGTGIRRLVRESCDWLVKIPGNPQVAALNVSNAAAVALYHLRKL